MELERIDLSALDLSEQRHAALVAEIVRQSGQELTRRAGGLSAIIFLGTWARPALAAAAVLAAVCGTMLARTSSIDMQPGSGIAEALGVPTTTTELLAANVTPTVGYMLAAEEDTQ
jgi:hypothetical protein